MRIAVTVDPYLPVPPRLYGGIERVVDFLVRGLSDRGHDVTLFAHPESHTAGRLAPYGVLPHVGLGPRIRELCQVGGKLWQSRRRFDVVHSFGRLAALLPVLADRRLAKIQSYQRELVPWRGVKTAVLLAGRSITFTACSASVFRQRPQLGALAGDWQAIFNGVDLAKYRFTPQVPADAPLVFLGRLERCKGPQLAIQIAKTAGRRLILAGNRVPSSADEDFFERDIEPHLDGDRITFAGPVDDEQKSILLGSAVALLMPILWEEPFGIVMAEALACGTPVIAFRRGSVPEVIRPGINGFICGDVEEAARAIEVLPTINRSDVRADCDARFSSTAITRAYEALYERMLNQ